MTRERPDPRDTRGTVIAAGARVAYNLSGYVVEGRVLSHSARWKPLSWNPEGRWYWTFKIELQHAACGHGKGHVSTVREPKGILVLGDVH